MNPNLSNDLKKRIADIRELIGHNCELMCFCTSDKNNVGIIAGDQQKITKAMFEQIFVEEDPFSNKLYMMIRSIVANIIKTDTSIGEDMRALLMSLANAENSEHYGN